MIELIFDLVICTFINFWWWERRFISWESAIEKKEWRYQCKGL